MIGRGARVLLAVLCSVVAVTGTATLATAPIVEAQDIELPPELDPVLAVVSPVANPICEASGAATLIVPVVSGLVNDNLDTGGTIALDDLILDSLGPVYTVCGLLPNPPDSTCQLDNDIAAIMPEEITSFGLPPTIFGDLVDVLDNTLSLLGLADSGLSLTPVLQCTVRTDPGAADPPPPPVVDGPSAGPPAGPEVAAPIAGPALGSGLVVPSLSTPTPVAPNTPAAPTAGGPTTAVTTVGELIADVVPGWVRVLQLMVAGALAAFLLASWATSARIRRSGVA